MKNGIYDINIEEYHGGEGISRSSLIEFQKSPAHYFYKKNNPEIRQSVDIIKKNNALEFGNALHTYILERDKFFERYHTMPKVNRTTKFGKGMYIEIKEVAAGKALICVDAMQEIENMAYAIESHLDANALVSDALYEKSIFWTDTESQMLCKTRPDIWHNDFICDLKTCESASSHDFQRSIVKYGYHIQAAMIHEGIKNITEKSVTNFIFIAIEKEPPYSVAVYSLDSTAIQEGILQFKTIIKAIAECEQKNEWPGYPTKIISLPSYAFSQEPGYSMS